MRWLQVFEYSCGKQLIEVGHERHWAAISAWHHIGMTELQQMNTPTFPAGYYNTSVAQVRQTSIQQYTAEHAQQQLPTVPPEATLQAWAHTNTKRAQLTTRSAHAPVFPSAPRSGKPQS